MPFKKSEFHYDPSLALYLKGRIDENNCGEVREELAKILYGDEDDKDESKKSKKKKNKNSKTPPAKRKNVNTKSHKPILWIDLFISSMGGEENVAFALHDFIKYVLKINNLRTIAVGDVDSSATIIFCAGSRRLITPNTTMLIHGFRTLLEKDTALKETDIEHLYDDFHKTSQKYRNIFLQATNGKISEEQLIQMIRKETILTPKEILDMGLAHEII